MIGPAGMTVSLRIPPPFCNPTSGDRSSRKSAARPGWRPRPATRQRAGCQGWWRWFGRIDLRPSRSTWLAPITSAVDDGHSRWREVRPRWSGRPGQGLTPKPNTRLSGPSRAGDDAALGVEGDVELSQHSGSRQGAAIDGNVRRPWSPPPGSGRDPPAPRPGMTGVALVAQQVIPATRDDHVHTGQTGDQARSPPSTLWRWLTRMTLLTPRRGQRFRPPQAPSASTRRRPSTLRGSRRYCGAWGVTAPITPTLLPAGLDKRCCRREHQSSTKAAQHGFAQRSQALAARNAHRRRRTPSMKRAVTSGPKSKS